MTGEIDELIAGRRGKWALMQLRYMGFDQAHNVREYKFDGVAQGEITRHFVVSADLTLFLGHHVGMQEGPALCLQKLRADLETVQRLHHELTREDLLAYVSARDTAAARKASRRKWRNPHRSVPPPSG